MSSTEDGPGTDPDDRLWNVLVLAYVAVILLTLVGGYFLTRLLTQG